LHHAIAEAWRAATAGYDSIEHGLALTDAQIAQMIRQGTWLCPTLSVYYYDWAPENTPDGQRDRLRTSAHEQSFRKALKAGVKIAFGTDVGGFSWTDPIAQEFPRLVEFGMSPMKAIQSATVGRGLARHERKDRCDSARRVRR
jgi:imidazolonepropionase-like amidohydrolase